MGFPTYDQVRLGSYKQNKGTMIIGNAATDNAILEGRVTTKTKAGANIIIGSDFLYSQGNEYRYSVASWAGTELASSLSFTGDYLRAQANVASGGKGLRALERIAANLEKISTTLEKISRKKTP